MVTIKKRVLPCYCKCGQLVTPDNIKTQRGGPNTCPNCFESLELDRDELKRLYKEHVFTIYEWENAHDVSKSIGFLFGPDSPEYLEFYDRLWERLFRLRGFKISMNKSSFVEEIINATDNFLHHCGLILKHQFQRWNAKLFKL